MTMGNRNSFRNMSSPYKERMRKFGTMAWDRSRLRSTSHSEKAYNLRNISLGKRDFGKGLNPETGVLSNGIQALGTLKGGLGKITTPATMTGLAVGALGTVGMKATMWLEKSRMNMVKTMLPNTAYPAAKGRFGVRTGGGGPVGIEGMRFNFRRK